MKRDNSRTALLFYIQKYGLETSFPEPYYHGLELHHFQKGEFLCRMDEPILYFSLIVEGRAQVIPASEDGRIVMLSWIGPLDMIGDIELFNNCSALYDVCADEHLTALSIPGKYFYQQAMENLAFAQMVCRRFAQKIYNSSTQHSTSMLYPLRCRLGRYLVKAAEITGSTIIPVHMLSLAHELGSSDRHLRRILKDLEKEGVLTKKRHSITIQNIAFLKEL